MRLPLVARFAPPLLAKRHLAAMSAAAPNKLPRPPDVLGDEMKQYEADTCASTVDLLRPVVVRLDGHCFSTYTKGFDRPYDLRIHRAMVSTAGDLLTKFGAVTAYTESDEISLIFHPHSEEMPSTLPFNGRVQKVVSVFAGYASARFNFHMLRESFDDEASPLESSSNGSGSNDRSGRSKSGAQAALRAKVEESSAHFDGRVFALPTLERLIAYVRWRAVLDCKRNSISMLSQVHFSQKVGVLREGFHCESTAVNWHRS
jgi:tRNA(His) guanylyltransferase